MDYERDMFIDDSALDVEWLEQSMLMMRYSTYEADKEREKDLAKEALDLVKADLDRNIRENPDKYGIAKPTETAISNTIISQEEYKEAYHKFLDIQYEYNIAKSATRAVAQRKDALENLVRLHGQQYFAGPRVPRNLHEEVEKRKNIQKRIRKYVRE